MKIDVRMGLAARDMLGGAEQPAAEMMSEPEPLERAAQPACRAGGGHRLGNGRKCLEKSLDAGDRGDFVQPELESLLRARTKVVRKRAPDLGLDDDAGVAPVEADIAPDRLVQGDGMAELRQSFGENGVGEDLAVDDDSVEIENYGLEPQLLSPNRAEPTRTWVAPIATAVS